MGEISIRHQLQSENVFFSFDSYLPEFLVPYANATLGDQRAAKSALCGWTEVTEETCDLLLYHIEPSGQRPHSVERSEEHTSELQSLMRISYAVFCLKKQTTTTTK